MKKFKEYIGTTGARLGGVSHLAPIASLGDTPPKGVRSIKASKDVKGTPLHRHLVKKGIIKK